MISAKLSQLMAAAVACLATTFAVAQEDPPRLVEVRSCFFAGQTATLGLRGVPENARIAWALHSSGRILDRGASRAVSRASDGQFDRTEIEFPLPAVREGVVLPVECRITLPGGVNARHSVWLYPEAAFPQHNPWWEAQPIRLYEPASMTTAGRNAASCLESQGVPFQSMRSVAQIEESEGGVVLIGQGISLDERPNLVESLTQVARGGGRVVCLAPSEGDWTLDWDGSAPDLLLRVLGGLTAYDKRFDRLPVASPVGLSSRRGQVRLRCGEGPWTWAIQRFHQGSDTPDGQLTICCLDLIKAWDDSPVPRHLLANLLKLPANEASH